MIEIETHPEVMGMREVARWLGGHYVGSSSKCMALWLGFGILSDDRYFPWDSDDFGRCVRLLNACPHLRECVPQMASISPVWKQLVAEWDFLMRLWDEEGAAKNWRRPALNKEIRRITEGRRE